MLYRGVLAGLLIPSQTLGSLLPDGIPPGSEIQLLFVNDAALAHTQTVRPPGADRPTCQQGKPASMLGRGPSNHRSQTVCDATESTTVGTHHSDWRPNRCQQGVFD
jgi:hypothetical protein